MEKFKYEDGSLEEIRSWLRAHIDAGAECPACNQLVKLYKRRLNKSMAAVLILIYRWDRDRQKAIEAGTATAEQQIPYVHVPSLIAELGGKNPRQAAALRGDFAKLKHWELLAEMPAKREDGSKRNGYYKITERGIAFVKERIRVPAYVWIYNEAVITTRPVLEQVTIREALKASFNYTDLMDGR